MVHKWSFINPFEECNQCKGARVWHNGIGLVACEQCKEMGVCLASLNKEERELLLGS